MDGGQNKLQSVETDHRRRRYRKQYCSVVLQRRTAALCVFSASGVNEPELTSDEITNLA